MFQKNKNKIKIIIKEVSNAIRDIGDMFEFIFRFAIWNGITCSISDSYVFYIGLFV